MAEPASTAPTVALLGTGAMGMPVGRRLARAGLPLRVWNRTAARARRLAADGAVICGDAASASDGADVLLTLLSDGPAVAETVETALRPGLVWAQMSTVGIAWTERLAALARERDVLYVDAPVVGTVAPAEHGELVVLAAGEPAALDLLGPVFEPISKAVVRLGKPPNATRLKLVINFWSLSTIGVMAEAVALAEGLGVGARPFLDVIAGGLSDSAYARGKAELMLTGAYPAAVRLEVARKDLELAADAAHGAALQLPAGAGVLSAMGEAISAGLGDSDVAAVFEVLRQRPDPPRPTTSRPAAPSAPCA